MFEGLQLVMFDTQGNVAFGLLDDDEESQDDGTTG